MGEHGRTGDPRTDGTETVGVPFDDLGVSGLLTRSDREFLIGEKTYEKPVDERKARNRLRNRIRNGLRDFELLANHLDERDRVQLFGDVTAQVPDDVYRDDEITGMVYAIAFLYAGARDAKIPFETVIEQGIRESRDVIQANPFAFRDVEVEIEFHGSPTVDLDDVSEKIEAGDELTDLEMRGIKRVLFSEPDRFVEATGHIDVSREETYDAGETLSIGESLVLFARGLQNPSRMDPGVDGEVLHERVRREFGLEQFLHDVE